MWPQAGSGLHLKGTQDTVKLSIDPVRSLGQEHPLDVSWGNRGKWQPTSVLLPGKSHGQRSLVGYSPWGHKESDTTE